ncbi:MAG: T9SS type A sorting domain-containing protein [FCB group bacterium]|nr:T9SS type A sorting domain-containing protein [FCB group bacterium]MBL7028447.1 T9SS type A sorting domain-containing protein [Candidatus Neomarinimicrobiota bacterium]MBL7122361.1 T9SS type A sorting domain-containing protein [Candidatus Neomarinimicrobiota bacterium]
MKLKKILSTLLFISTVLFADPEIVRFSVIENFPDPLGGSLWWTNEDGSLLGGAYYFGSSYLWTAEEGVEHTGGRSIRAMDNNGLLVGESPFPMMMGDTITDVDAACYYDGEEWVMIGPIQGTQPFDPYMYQGAWAVAADTFIVAGMYWHDNYRTTAFVWTPEDPDGELLPDNGLLLSSRPNDMSADGSVIVGWASIEVDGQYTDRSAHAWVLNELTGEYELVFLGYNGDQGGWVAGEAFGVSPSGNYICGWSPNAMFVWTEETGMQDIGFAPGHNPVEAGVIPMDIIDDGTSVGFAQAQTWIWTRDAIIYTPENGISYLKDSLQVLVDDDDFLEDWFLPQANGISDDGKFIVGSAIGLSGIITPFIVEFIHPTAPTDLESQITNDPLGTWIELNWVDDPSNNEFNYHLQRRVTIADSTSEWATLAYPDSSHSSYVDAEIYIANGVEWEYRLRSENPVGESEWVEIMTASDVDEIGSGLPKEFTITGAYPNPFNPITNIQYELPERMNTQIVLYSVTGTELAVLSDGIEEAGNHSLQIDMSGYNSGVYLVRIISGHKMNVQKLTLIK